MSLCLFNGSSKSSGILISGPWNPNKNGRIEKFNIESIKATEHDSGTNLDSARTMSTYAFRKEGSRTR